MSGFFDVPRSESARLAEVVIDERPTPVVEALFTATEDADPLMRHFARRSLRALVGPKMVDGPREPQ